jgi:hypothetical protein
MTAFEGYFDVQAVKGSVGEIRGDRSHRRLELQQVTGAVDGHFDSSAAPPVGIDKAIFNPDL